MSQEQSHTDALAALRRIATSAELRDNERSAIANELREIEEMERKLADSRVEIAVFGEINAGKSALLNALLGREVFSVAARGGETRARAKQEWKPEVKELAGHGSKLVVVDTPGLNEVDGADRAVLAERTVRQSDIVLFVVKGDINEVEHAAIKQLHDLNKPLVLVFNQIDRLRQKEIDEATQSIKRKLSGILHDRDIVYAAGRPRPKVVVRIAPDGTEKEEEIEQKPIIEDVQRRVLEILMSEGKAIVALNASLFAANVSERIAQLKAEARQQEAQRLIEKYMVIKALGVAANPIPVVDIMAGMASDVAMLVQLSKVYGQPLSLQNADKLAQEILGAWGIAAAVEWATGAVAGLLKAATFGLATVLTAAPQGLAAAWTTFIVGNAAHAYFRDGGWGKGGPKAVVQSILANASPESVLAPLRGKIEGRLRNRPA